MIGMAEGSIVGYARFCSVFAVFGVVFLFIIGQMLQKQPLYIKGPEDKKLLPRPAIRAQLSI